MNNTSNIKLLKEVYNSTNKIAVFVGAGTSKFLDIPGWDDLLENMKKKFGLDIDIKKSIMEDGYPKTASKIYSGIGNKELYLNFLANQFIPRKGRYYSLHLQLLNLFKVILTTNFDTTFEAAHNEINDILILREHSKERLGIQKLPKFNFDEILMYDRTLIYLHGNNDDNIYILRDEEYRYHYSSLYGKSFSDLESLLREIFLNYCIIFIGFSFRDEHFVKFFKKIINEEYIRLKNEFESIYDKEYPRHDIPKYFTFVSENEISVEIDEDFIEKIGIDNLLKDQLFIQNNRGKLEFKKNAEDIILKKINNIQQGDILISELKRCTINKERIEILNELNINIIIIPNNNYNEIENILNELKHIQPAEIEEAAYAK